MTKIKGSPPIPNWRSSGTMLVLALAALGACVLLLTIPSELFELKSSVDVAQTVPVRWCDGPSAYNATTAATNTTARPVKLTLFGERHSGTNFLQATLQLNFDVQVTWKYGWKHFWLDAKRESPRLDKLREDEDVAVVVIFREPVTWLLAMYREPHHSSFNRSATPFHGFLERSPFRSFEPPSPWKYPPPPDSLVLETRRDIFELRAAKIRAMLAIHEWHGRFYALPYERLRGHQRAEIKQMARVLCLPWKDQEGHFQKLQERIAPGGVWAKSRPPKQGKDEKRLQKQINGISRRTRKLLCQSLDCEAEALAGYTGKAVKLDCCTRPHSKFASLSITVVVLVLALALSFWTARCVNQRAN